MALKLICDGCGHDLAREDAQEFGRLGKVWYCAHCAEGWTQIENELRDLQVALSEQWETRRKTLHAGFRARSQTLPDE